MSVMRQPPDSTDAALAGLDGRPAPSTPAAADAGGVPPGGPWVAIITVNYNGGRFIGEFLASLRALTYEHAHLVAVDCASTDGSADEIARLWPAATLIRSAENLGFTGGNNLGIEWALRHGFTHVLFLNNDTVVQPGLLEALVTRAGGRTLVAPRVELYGSGGLMDDTVGEFDWRRGVWRNWVYGRPCPPELRNERDVPMASLCCLLVPVSVFRHAGMLDERLFMYYEDFDFIARARSAGYRIRYVPDTVVYHRKSASSGGGDSPFKLYYATRNRVSLLRRYAPPGRFLAFSIDFALTRLARAARFTASGQTELASAMLRGWLDAYRGRVGRTFPPPGAAQS